MNQRPGTSLAGMNQTEEGRPGRPLRKPTLRRLPNGW